MTTNEVERHMRMVLSRIERNLRIIADMRVCGKLESWGPYIMAREISDRHFRALALGREVPEARCNFWVADLRVAFDLKGLSSDLLQPGDELSLPPTPL